MNLIPLVAGTLVAVSAAGAGVWYLHSAEDGAPIEGPQVPVCQHSPIVPFTAEERSGATAGFRWVVQAKGAADTGLFCLYDQRLQKRAEVAAAVPADGTTVFELHVPPGVYSGWMVLGNYEGDQGYGALGMPWTRDCGDEVHEQQATHAVTSSGRTTTGSSGGCVAAARVGPASVPSGNEEQPPWGLVAGIAAVPLLGLLAWRTGLPAGALGLFSRLSRPRVLDQAVRSQILSLVELEPGIHSRRIAQTLELGQSRTTHHLRILCREGILTALGAPGFRHYFVRGQYAPERMRALAALRRPSFARLYHAIAATPDQSLADVARTVGTSVSRASRVAKGLAEAGLIQRHGEGGSLRLRARGV